LKIYNLLGEEVATLVNKEQMQAGYHSVVWDGRDAAGNVLASGVYFTRMQGLRQLLTIMNGYINTPI